MKTTFDIAAVKADFPVLQTQVQGKPLVYLDHAATAQKPAAVIDAMTDFYRTGYATIHRGVYSLSQESTARFDEVRAQIASFLGAKRPAQIIFVRGTTEAINLVAYSYGRPFIKAGDEIIASEIEHHANLVPWQQLCLEKGCVLRIIPVDDAGVLDISAYESLLSEKTALVAIGHVSNALGTIHPVKDIVRLAHGVGAKVLIDGAQGVGHFDVNVSELDCDFYCFSGHKLYGPTGIGVLYAKYELLDKMVPYQTGGDMIEFVTFEKTTFAKPPEKFEAGTPAIAEVIGLGAAITYLRALGSDAIAAHEHALLAYATKSVLNIAGLRIIGTAPSKSGVISFVLEDIHPHDIGTILDSENIAIRAGHHCSQTTMKRFGVPATARASFGVYTDYEDIDRLIAGIKRVKEIFS